MKISSDIDRKPYIKVTRVKNYKIYRYEYEKKDNVDNVDNVDSDIEKYCRGMITDLESNVLLLPPSKSKIIDIDRYFRDFSECDVEPIIDGVMVNLVYNRDEWILSTRSYIGGYNKWNKNLNFKNMFDECKNFEYEDLDKNNTYSFVVRHKSNRLVGKILYNEIYLVEMRDKDFNIVDKSNYDNKFLRIESVKLDKEKEIFKTYEIRGYTFNKDGVRYKIENGLYNYVKSIRGNHNDRILNYLDIRRDKKLKREYLEYYPEELDRSKRLEDKIEELIHEIYWQYSSLKIEKNITMSEVSYHCKPCINDLHRIYINERKKINKRVIIDYINKMEIYRLKFILNYIN